MQFRFVARRFPRHKNFTKLSDFGTREQSQSWLQYKTIAVVSIAKKMECCRENLVVLYLKFVIKKKVMTEKQQESTITQLMKLSSLVVVY